MTESRTPRRGPSVVTWPRVLVTLVVLCLPMLAGCLSSTPGSPVGTSSEDRGATYRVVGPLLLPGFWPTPEFDFLENATVNITVGETRTVADAAGHPVTAVNVTFRAGPDWATHWVDPGSGRVVVVSAPRAELGVQWDWTVSGEEAFFGHWEALRGSTSWPERIEVSCCPDSKAFRKFVEPGSAVLALVDRGTATGDPPAELEANTSWAPPEPRNVTEYAWNGHHAPEGDHPTSLPIERALRVAREENDTVRAFMEEHPDWQVVAGAAIQNPGRTVSSLATDQRGDGRWVFDIASPQSRVEYLGVEVVEEAYTPEELDESRTVALHDVGALLVEGDRWLGWHAPRSLDMMGMSHAWKDVEDVVEPSEIAWRVIFQYNTTAGPLWMAGLHYDWEAYDPETDMYQLQEALIDLETGLLAGYTGYRDPVDVFKRPLPG